MAEPALRTRIHVRFPEGTVIELDRDPGRSIGDLVAGSTVGAFWDDQAKFLIRDKRVAAGSDIEPPEVRYEVEPLDMPATRSGSSAGPEGTPT
jgi:hypothetical protein